MIGTALGHYRIERLLGTGGMGEVYLAHDTKLGRDVALKVLSAAVAADPDRRERFEREARAAAALNHPNIVTIHSVEEVDGTPFLTLEVVDGQTLSDVIPEGGLPLDRVLTLGIPLADAVGAAHQRGVTHRDLKPANVMVTTDGRVKVLDFGLAKVKEDVRLAAEAGLPTALTGDGRIVGTVAYMSPEQAEGKPVDQRSDVFSLGIILYEMATGARPFSGDTHMSTLSAIIKDTPKSVGEVRAGLPREFCKIVSRCLAKDLEDRYQSAKDLRNDLRALKNDLTSGDIEPISGSGVRSAAAVAPPLGKRNHAVVVGIGALLLAAAAAGFWWKSAGAPATQAVRPFDAIKLTRLTTTGRAGLAAMSLDGRYVAHVAFTPDRKQGLWLRQIATTSNVEVVPAAEVRYAGLTFSPDGNHIYYATYPRVGNIASLYQVGVLGGGARLILGDVDTAVTFRPDGKEFAFIRGNPADGSSAIVIANADGSNLRTFAVRRRPLRYPLLSVAWSPDGRLLAATGSNDDELHGQVVIIDAGTAKETVLPTPDWRQVSRVAWLPDGSGLLVNAQESAGESSNQIFVVSYPSGASRRITNDLSSYSGLGVAPDGKSFVTIRNERKAAIWTMAVNSRVAATVITAEAAADEGTQGIAWAPDGRIVYTTEASGNPDIWIMNADGSRRVQLTSTPGLDTSPRVTGDGRYIVFVSDRDGAIRPWRMALDGSGALRLSADVVARLRVNLSSDGKWIYYNESHGGESRKVPIDGGPVQSVFSAEVVARLSTPLPRGFHEPMPSPDGSAFSGHYNTARGERIVVVPAAGGAVKFLETVPPSAQWTADSRGFIYIDSGSAVPNLFRQMVAGGAPVAVTQFTSEQIFNFALSPDQKHAAVVRGRVSSDVVLVATAEK